VNHFQELTEYFRFTTGNEVNQLEKQRKQEYQRVMEINRLECIAKKKAQLTGNEVNEVEHVVKKKASLTENKMNHFQEEVLQAESIKK